MLIRFLAFATFFLTASAASAFETRATAAYIYDVTTGTVLYEKDADIALPPASMSKIMTLNMLFEALADGRVRLDDTFSVSSRAQAMGGSTMFLNESDKPTVEELIQGIIVSSGNDATVTVAEALAGTEDAFARSMNERAKTIGMTNSTFANASGWPSPNHRMSMRDLGTLAVRIIEEFPEYYGYFAQAEFDYKDRSPANRFNRNPVLRLDLGADGLKTGHTEEAGYGLVGSAVQGTRRIVFVITGLTSAEARAEESQSIIAWAFRQFVEKDIVKAGTVLTEAEVWLGEENRVGLQVAEDISLLVPALVQDQIEAEITYRTPLNAPVTAGEQIGELVIPRGDLEAARVPLVADRSVAEGGFLPRLRTATGVLATRYLGDVEGVERLLQ